MKKIIHHGAAFNKAMDEHAKKWNLDAEEREWLEVVESGRGVPLKGAEKERVVTMLRDSARAKLRKTKTINVRVTPYVYNGIKARASAEGMPYQTFIGSLLHKAVSA
jgi:predicted DNA binding CopG/RHH family protein